MFITMTSLEAVSYMYMSPKSKERGQTKATGAGGGGGSFCSLGAPPAELGSSPEAEGWAADRPPPWEP